jgi:hypothetical protein
MLMDKLLVDMGECVMCHCHNQTPTFSSLNGSSWWTRYVKGGEGGILKFQL